eukprot:jgi/Galph1/4446/GphlegSOOS_G3055.1
MNTSKPKVIVIAGPTGVGKTKLSLQVAKSLGGEIISADSVQVYRKMDIGSNKPSLSEREGIPHHLIDIVEPTHEFSAGEFFQLARSTTQEILQRGKIPIVVGGTSMYVRWFIYGLPATPPSSACISEQVSQKLEEMGGNWDSAIQLLRQVDPLRASKVCRNDWYRLRRALEVYYAAGRPLSELPLQGGAPNPKKETQSNKWKDLDYDFRCYFLVASREKLNRLIDRRCEQMIQKGLLKEVFSLLHSGALSRNSSAGRAIGYRQTIDYLLNEEKHQNSTDSFLNYVQEFQNASRQYARRQLQWFRGEELFHWLPCSYWQQTENLDPLRYILESYHSSYEAYRESVICRADAMARRQSSEEAKEMKKYVPRLELFQDSSLLETFVQEAEHYTEMLLLSTKTELQK